MLSSLPETASRYVLILLMLFSVMLLFNKLKSRSCGSKTYKYPLFAIFANGTVWLPICDPTSIMMSLVLMISLYMNVNSPNYY